MTTAILKICKPTEYNRKHIGTKWYRLSCIDFAGRDYKSNAYFKFLCDCGKEKVIDIAKVKNGSTKSCGCLLNESRRKKRDVGKGNTLPYGEAHFNSYFHQYKVAAEKRNYTFNINKEQFREIVSKECYYCNLPPQPICQRSKGHNGQFIGNGIDRKDNTIGYELGNLVPCCIMCNKMKRDYSYGDYINKIRRIYEHLQLDR
jgi:hypothetical protein